MTTEREEPGQRTDRKLDDIVRDADEYYNYLRAKDVKGTRLDVAVMSILVWFSAFVVLALSSLAISGCFSPSSFSSCVSSSSPSKVLVQSLSVSALAAFVIAAATGLATYIIRRRRRFKFADLGALLNKMKEGGVSSEDGLHLMDAVHQAALVVKKRKVGREALEYGLVAFILVGLIGSNAAVGMLAGVIVYLYFRFEALREYEKEEKKYEDSKKGLFQSL